MGEKKVAAFFDFDGTLFRGHFWQGVVKHHMSYRVKRFSTVAFLLIHIPLYYLSKLRFRDEEAFKVRWGEDLPSLFKGFSKGEASLAFRWIVNDFVMELLRIDTMMLLKEHKEQGHLIVLLSGTYREFLEELKPVVGADYSIGTGLELKDGFYTGKITEPLCFGKGKAGLLKEFMGKEHLDIDLAASYAYADSISDLPVFEMVGHPVATYPDKRLEALAKARGWKILR